MAEKRRYTVTLPDHVADAVDSRAKPLSATPTEYAADVIRWWFGQGCPPVTHDEAELRRVKSLPTDLDVWSLNPKDLFTITDDNVVKALLSQLGLPNLYAQASEHDEARFLIAFDNHPTHWIVVDLFKGSNRPDGDGLSFRAYPKASTTRDEVRRRMQRELKEMESKEPFEFSQIPILDTQKSGGTTLVGSHRSE